MRPDGRVGLPVLKKDLQFPTFAVGASNKLSITIGSQPLVGPRGPSTTI